MNTRAKSRSHERRIRSPGGYQTHVLDLDELDVPRRLVGLTRLASEVVDAACEAGVISVRD